MVVIRKRESFYKSIMQQNFGKHECFPKIRHSHREYACLNYIFFTVPASQSVTKQLNYLAASTFPPMSTIVSCTAVASCVQSNILPDTAQFIACNTISRLSTKETHHISIRYSASKCLNRLLGSLLSEFRTSTGSCTTQKLCKHMLSEREKSVTTQRLSVLRAPSYPYSFGKKASPT